MAVATASVVDETGQYAGSLELIARDAVAGFEAWLPYLATSAGSIQIEVRLVDPRPELLATGAPYDVVFASDTVVDSGAAFELLTGVDLDPSTPDIVIELDADFLSTGVQIDPLDGTGVAANRTSLVSVMAHEVGHGLGYFGARDVETYQPDPDADGVQSVFDTFITFVDGAPFFEGLNAMAVYGGRVPQTREHLYHLGNESGSGAGLASDLMFYRANPGTTAVSRLDAAVLSDLGMATIFDDTLAGSDVSDTMFGGRGDDIVFGFSANDSLSGEDGEDYLRGGDGADRLSGGAAFDDLNGNVGNDTVGGGLGDDWAVGGKDDDLLGGDEGDDIVYGNLGNDWCDGGPGADLIRGGQDNDVLLGQQGDDWMSGDRGNDTLTGGAGADIFHTFGDTGLDRVTDFNRAQGDRVMVDPGTVYSVSQSGADVVIGMGAGNQMVLAGVQMSSLTGDWIFGA